VRLVREAKTGAERAAVMEGLSVDHATLSRYKKVISTRDSKIKKEREPLTARRLSGGGRRAKLTKEQEAELEKWVMELRHDRLRVTEKMVKFHARNTYNITASDMWVRGFMKRRGFSMRQRTTNKDVNTEKLQSIARHFRNKFASLFAIKSHSLIFNMDETPLYFDAPGNRTIDKIGAKTVEIATTKHEKDRITVVLCASCFGAQVDTLVIHRTGEKKRMKKTNNLSRQIITAKDKRVPIWISHSPTAYMNHSIMTKWIEEIYKVHTKTSGCEPSDSVLFLDNMGAHKMEEIEDVFTQHRLPTIFFPPNCTPILQPLDHSINAVFKRLYEEEWARWYREVGCRRLTKHGNKKKPSESDVNGWVAAALSCITPELVRKSWRHTLMAPLHLMRLPSHPWKTIITFLNEEEKAQLIPDLSWHRSKYDASQFVFPVPLNKKRRKSEEEKGEANAQKRKRGGGEEESDELTRKSEEENGEGKAKKRKRRGGKMESESTINNTSSPPDIPLPATVRLNKKGRKPEEEKGERIAKKRKRRRGEKENDKPTINNTSSPADIPLPAIVLGRKVL
jgi:hypothetical protein